MSYMTFMNWEILREVIGLIICILAMWCLAKKRTDFKHEFYLELNKENVKDIRQQLTVLKQQNRKMQEMMNTEPRLTDQKYKKKYTHQRYATDSSASGFQVISGKDNDASNTSFDTNHSFLKQSHLTKYEQIKRLANDGMDQNEIQRKLEIPKAEIDFVLKFHRLNRLSRAHMSQNSQKVAYL